MNKLYENYPIEKVIITVAIQLLLCVAGAYIMFRLSWITGGLYIAFLIFLERSIYKEGCRYCYYYNKRCAFGRGKLAPIFFKKGNPKKFCEREIKWKDFVPMMLASLIPVIVGIALLISRGFHLLTLIAILYPIANWFVINPILYGQLACKHCKQGGKCCPALEFFSKSKKKAGKKKRKKK